MNRLRVGPTMLRLIAVPRHRACVRVSTSQARAVDRLHTDAPRSWGSFHRLYLNHFRFNEGRTEQSIVT